MKTIVLAMALAVVLVAVHAGAEECVPTTRSPSYDTGNLAGTGTGTPDDARFYIDTECANGCLFALWVYQESNGIDGLQRGDEAVDDTCGGAIDSDTIVF